MSPVLATTSIRASRSRAVVTVKASKHRNSDDTCRIGPPLERSRSRHALSDPLVGPCDVEIVEAVLIERALDVPLAEDDEVIETVAPDAAEKSLTNRIHERSVDCRPKNAHAGALCGTVEVGAELAVVVTDDELGRGAEGRGLPELLRRPLRRWVPSYPDMHDLFGIDVDDEERKDRPEPDVVGLQEIAGSHRVVVQESVPALPARRRRTTTITHVPLHRPLRDADSELEQLTTNALGAPEPILSGHAADQLDEVRRHARSRRHRRPRLRAPEQAKPFHDASEAPSRASRAAARRATSAARPRAA